MIRLIDERIMEKLRDKPENIDFVDFVALVGEWREERVQKPKCPYCVKPIERQATKCSGCLSELEWFKFDDLYGPCKMGSCDDVLNALSSAKKTFLDAFGAERKARLDEKIERLTSLRCYDCDKYLVDKSKVNLSSEEDVKAAEIKFKIPRDSDERSFFCASCKERRDRNLGRAIIVIIIILIITLVFLASLNNS